ncbi:hypothetical protein CORC01_08095 [Colletotrichum orchidophilum]|uniref:CFEM domain-containing protein n=1 Tax=Colletotrichum orchidophilum TaxID=1209926 RepID=A0A1G4B5B7_9PEZI|nr:uncharacterized protein CORC01_08095 [Colletotrichum orchidophilum]OHE96638.1 hypothetical protein CORC01_08095 [Colletotrichum orchidophilum]
MKFTLALVAAAGLVIAQDFSGQPKCALSCLAEAIPKVGCNLTDTACQCTKEKQEALAPIAAPCLLAACNSTDLTAAQNAAAKACADFAATAGSAQPTASAAPSVPLPVSTVLASASASITATPASNASAPFSNATVSASRAGTATASGTGARSTAPSTGNAAAQGSVAVGGLALAAIAGIAAVL